MLSNNEEQIDSKSGKLDNQNISNENNNPLDSYLLEKTIVIKVGGSTLGFDYLIYQI